MGLQEFQDLLDRYGGDPRTWPADRRPAALALAETSPDAFRRLEEMRRIESMLADDNVPAPSVDAIDRVMARIRDHEERLTGAVAPQEAAGAGGARSLLGELMNALDGLLYRPLPVFTMVSLLGIAVGIADRAASLQEIQRGFLYFIMTL